jgi:hypothetical protein
MSFTTSCVLGVALIAASALLWWLNRTRPERTEEEQNDDRTAP